ARSPAWVGPRRRGRSRAPWPHRRRAAWGRRRGPSRGRRGPPRRGPAPGARGGPGTSGSSAGSSFLHRIDDELQQVALAKGHLGIFDAVLLVRAVAGVLAVVA